MTETEKIFKSVLSSYKPVNKKKKIVTESKNKKETKKIIKESAKESIQEAAKAKTEAETELDDNEKVFIDKFIEYSQLSLLNQSAEQLTATFEKSLGPNAQIAIKQLMTKISQRENRIKELAKQLIAIKQQMIKETEKVRAKETLINLASNISIPVEKSKSKSKTQINKSNIIDKPTAAQDVTSTINVVESKKKSKKK